MEPASSRIILLVFSMLSLFAHQSISSTVVVDGVTNWNDPTAYIGDSIIFKHKNEYRLYIFQNKGAFQVCNFTRATLLTKPNTTTFTWHPSRPGLFYFSFNDGSSKPCQDGQKLAINVSSSPADPWPFQPQESLSPSPSQVEFLPPGPSSAPGRGGGLPFINSDPVVPFPTGEVDSAKRQPMPTSQGQVVVGFLASEMVFCFVTFVLLLQH